MLSRGIVRRGAAAFVASVGLCFLGAMPAAHAITGALSGQYQTTQSGMPAYSLPIELPPGIGVRPSLSLVYNGGGEGIAGQGWNVSGVEAITRCPATRHQDGFFDPVDFDANDRFCLNGQRLVAVQGAYGQPLTEYRTEIDGYARIRSYGNSYGGGRRTGPGFFMVWLKSGEIRIYGKDPRARERAKAGVTAWYLWRVLDRYGNYIQYNYYESTVDAPGQAWHEHYLKSIEYSGNNRTGEAPFVRVTFHYRPRARALVRYAHGTEYRTTRLLHSVRVTGAGRFLREYFLHYDADDQARGWHRLVRIDLCMEAGRRNCLAPLGFTYGPRPAVEVSKPVLWVERAHPMGYDQSHWPMDVDGNGLTDMVYNVKGTPRYHAILNLGGGKTQEIHWATRSKDVGYDPKHWVADVNGDGRMDLIYNQAGTDRYLALVSRGDSQPAREYLFGYRGTGQGADDHWVMDIDADGRSDLVFREGRRYYAMQGGRLCDVHGPSCTPPAVLLGEARYRQGFGKRHYPIDVNGDGLVDLVYGRKGTREYRVLLARLSPSGKPWFEERKWGVRDVKHIGYGNQHWILDANGDGLADLLFKKDGETNDKDWYYILLNTGNPFSGQGFIEEKYGYRTSEHDHLILDSRHIIMDVNGDGRSDVLFVQDVIEQEYVPGWGYVSRRTGYEYFVMVSGPNGLQQGPVRSWAKSTIRTKKDIASHWQMDIDGDGMPELLVKHPTTREYFVLRDRNAGSSLSESRPLDRLVEVRDGLGARTRIHYLPFADARIYRNERGTGYPVRHMPPTGLGVYRVETSNGLRSDGLSFNRMEYRYFSRRLDLGRRMPLGFEKIVEYNPQTRQQAETVYFQHFPLAGSVRSTTTYLLSGGRKRLKASATSYPSGSHRVLRGVEAKYYQLLGSRGTSSEFEITDGSLIKRLVTENRDIDAYGNVGTVISETHAPGGLVQRVVTKNRYENHPDKWILGRLVRSEVTHTGPGGPGRRRVSAFAYDSNTGVLTREIIEPDNRAFRLEKRYGYNRYGMRTLARTLAKTGVRYPIPEVVERTQVDFSRLRSEGILTITRINALGHRERETVDALLGVTLERLGPNGLAARGVSGAPDLALHVKHDRLGREIDRWQEVKPGVVVHTRTYRQWCRYVRGCPAGAKYRILVKTDGEAPVIAYYDVLGRKFMTESRGLHGERIGTKTEYDALGRTRRVSQPFYIDSGGPEFWTRFRYDALGRVVREERPDGGYTEKSYYRLRVTTRQGGPGVATQARITDTDVLGRLVRVTDAQGNVTRYEYDASGNLVAVTDAAGNVTRAGYNFMGWRTRIEDPDMGVVQTEYDALGRARREQDAKGNVTLSFYDRLGRLVKVREYDAATRTWATSAWHYDDTGDRTAGASLGKLYLVTGAGDYSKRFEYDTYGRVVTETIQFESGSKAQVLHRYDRLGRPFRVRYPSGRWIERVYNSFGHLVQVRSPGQTPFIFWEARATDVFGNLTQEEFGNGRIITTRVFDRMGRIQAIITGKGVLGNEIQDLEYAFDSLGNLVRREDRRQGLRERFQYDTLNRLVSAEFVGVGRKTYAYDRLGNLRRKGAVNDYRYGENGAGPHAVTYAAGKRYYYDRNGNLISGGGREILWTAFDKPKRITRGGTVIRFFYGPDHARYKQVKSGGGKTTVTYYVGKLYERVVAGGKVTHKDYIGAGSATVVREITAGQVRLKYLFKDHLGSTDVVTDATGRVLERSSFAPFGTRRRADWRDPVGKFLTSAQTTRGFTGHEQLDDVGLIHMNGRVYDPELGRFLSPDPNVQAPLNSQSLNRYSYVLNNPLSYTDPSGFFFEKLGDLIRDLAQNPLVRTAVMMGCSVSTQGLGAATCVGVASAALTKAAGGSWEDAVRSGAFAVASATITGQIGDLQQAGKITALEGAALHGLAQGALTTMQGGSFTANFAAAAFSKVAAPTVGRLPGGAPVQLIAQSVLGGTVSRIAGGKFANGAQSAAFVYLFNEVRHRRNARSIKTEIIDEDGIRSIYIFYKNKLVGAGFYDLDSERNVAIWNKIKPSFDSEIFIGIAHNFSDAGRVFLFYIGPGGDCRLGCTENEGVILDSSIKNVEKWSKAKFTGYAHTYKSWVGCEMNCTVAPLTWDTVFIHELGHVYYDEVLKPRGFVFTQRSSSYFYSDRSFDDEYVAVRIENLYRGEKGLPLRCGYRVCGDLRVNKELTAEDLGL